MNSLVIETLLEEPRNDDNAYFSIMPNHPSRQEKLSPEELLRYAQKMAFARDRLTALLISSKPGIFAMANEFIAQQQLNTKLSELINIKSAAITAVQETGFVQDTPKQLEQKVLSGFEQILKEIQVNRFTKTNDSAEFLKETQFLPRFLHQVIVRLEKNDKTGLAEQAFIQIKKQEKLMSQARSEIIKHNQALVFFAAKQYTKKSVSHIDLTQEGTLGLIKAVDRYDWKRSIKFSTYAMYWVKQTISRAIFRQEKIIRLPINLATKAPAVYATIKKYFQENGKWPTSLELANLCESSEEQITTILENAQPVISLSSHVNDNEEMPELESVLIQRQFKSAFSELINSDRREYLNSALKILTKREAEVIQSRFGLNNCQEMTLQDLGDQFGLSRERTRQIQNNALRKLKQSLSGKFNDFLETM